MAKIPFSWSDFELSPVAWRASTGSACPEVFDHADIWPSWERFAHLMGPQITEKVPSYKWDHKLNEWMTEGESWHLNVQTFVEQTREEFSPERTQERQLSQLNINTVGADSRTAWWWGWSAIVQAEVKRASWIRRVVRQTRYIYPRPGHDDFYVGSSIQFQKRAKVLDVNKHIEWWSREFDDFVKEHKVQFRSNPVQGWRPVGEPGKWTIDSSGDIEIAAMSASGVKFSPMVANQIVNYLTQKGYVR